MAAISFPIVGAFLVGILVCTFIGLLFGRRGVWPAAMALTLAFFLGIVGLVNDCIGFGAYGACPSPLDGFLAMALILVGVPLFGLMVAAAAIIVDKVLARPGPEASVLFGPRDTGRM